MCDMGSCFQILERKCHWARAQQTKAPVTPGSAFPVKRAGAARKEPIRAPLQRRSPHAWLQPPPPHALPSSSFCQSSRSRDTLSRATASDGHCEHWYFRNIIPRAGKGKRFPGLPFSPGEEPTSPDLLPEANSPRLCEKVAVQGGAEEGSRHTAGVKPRR